MSRSALLYLRDIRDHCAEVPEDVRARHPEVPWRRIAGMRDVIAHGYFALDDRVVRDVVQHEVPSLRTQVEAILASAPGRPE